MEKPSMVTSLFFFCFFHGVLIFLHGSTATAENCRESDIEIAQSPSEPLPNGIPSYIVEIANTCESDSGISEIHLNCGEFSSAIVITPKIFKRLAYDDCLVNGGSPLLSGHVLSFRYANTFLYPLSVKSVVSS